MQAIREYTPPIEIAGVNTAPYEDFSLVDALLQLSKEHQKRVDEYIKRT